MASVGFKRRFNSDPGLEELTSIEGVVVIDREPPPLAVGSGTGLVLCVGEFENGPFAKDVGPVEVLGGADLVKTFGDFGHTYDGLVASNPCGRKRLADATLVPEYWNGNGAIALARKRFRRLAIARVDTSVGEVSFVRLASLSGNAGFAFDLATGQELVFDIGAGNVTATFTGVPATIVSAAGTYPSTFAGGEWIDFAIDGTTYRATFLSSDQSQTEVIARLNLAAGYSAFTNAGPATDDTTLTGRKGGTGGSVQIVAVSGAAVTTATGFSAGAAVPGTGNVADIDQVTVAEADTIVAAASTNDVRVDRDAAGKIRIYAASAPTIEVDATTTADAFGFAEEVVASADSGLGGTIPAGTRIETSVGAREFVTMQDVVVTAASAGPYKARIRHALDDGSGTLAAVGAIDTIRYPLFLGAFKVANDLPVTASFTEAQIDAAYVAALAKTKGTANVGKNVSVVFSARQSNAIRNELRQNGIDASAAGCDGRTCIVRPPLKTLRSIARGGSQPGVGAYRTDRLDYAYPGGQISIPGIATRGTAGGEGFTADGVIDVGSDGWLASILSMLNPEENPGQETDLMSGFLGIEAGNADVQDLTIDDYKALKAAGICAPRIDNGVAFFQSGVNSVDPAQKALRNISRRRMADYINDSLAALVMPFVKKLATPDRKTLVVSAVDSFLSTLLSIDNPENQRIKSYSVKDVTSKIEAQAGVLRIRVKVCLLGSLDTIVIDSTIGETVETFEYADAA